MNLRPKKPPNRRDIENFVMTSSQRRSRERREKGNGNKKKKEKEKKKKTPGKQQKVAKKKQTKKRVMNLFPKKAISRTRMNLRTRVKEEEAPKASKLKRKPKAHQTPKQKVEEVQIKVEKEDENEEEMMKVIKAEEKPPDAEELKLVQLKKPKSPVKTQGQKEGTPENAENRPQKKRGRPRKIPNPADLLSGTPVAVASHVGEHDSSSRCSGQGPSRGRGRGRGRGKRTCSSERSSKCRKTLKPSGEDACDLWARALLPSLEIAASSETTTHSTASATPLSAETEVLAIEQTPEEQLEIWPEFPEIGSELNSALGEACLQILLDDQDSLPFLAEGQTIDFFEDMLRSESSSFSRLQVQDPVITQTSSVATTSSTLTDSGLCDPSSLESANSNQDQEKITTSCLEISRTIDREAAEARAVLDNEDIGEVPGDQELGVSNGLTIEAPFETIRPFLYQMTVAFTKGMAPVYCGYCYFRSIDYSGLEIWRHQIKDHAAHRFQVKVKLN